MDIKRYITFKNGFILMCILWLISNCAGNKLNRRVHTYEIAIEGKNVIVDSLQREINVRDLIIDSLSVESRLLRESIQKIEGSYNILVQSNFHQARTIRKQTEIDYE